MRKKTFKSNTVHKGTSEAMSGILIETNVNIDLKYLKNARQHVFRILFTKQNHKLKCLVCIKGCSHEKGVHLYIVEKEEIHTSDLKPGFKKCKC